MGVAPRVRGTIFCLLGLAWTLACGGGTEPSGPHAAGLTAVVQDTQSATVGTAVGVLPAVKVTDQNGDPLPDVTVTFTITQGGGSLTGGTATSGSDGIAAVGGWTLGTVAGLNQLHASVPRVPPVTFSATGLAGAPNRLALTTAPPPSIANGAVFNPAPVVQLRDQYGNAAPVQNVAVTVAIDSGAGSLGGTATVNTDLQGKAVFSGLAVTGAVGQRVLGFSATGLPDLRSGTIAVTAGPATTIAPNSSDSLSGVVGSTVAPTPQVVVRDQSGNPVPSLLVLFQITAGGGSLTGATPVTDSVGVAVVGSWVLGQTVATNTLTATVSGLTPVTFTATGLPGTVQRLVVTQQPGTTTAQNGLALVPQPIVQVGDQFGNPLKQQGVVVTASLGSGGGTLGGTLTATTDTGGKATFTNLAITGLVGNHTLRFDGSLNAQPLNPGVSAVFVLAAGAPASIVVSAGGAVQTAPVATAVPVVPAVLVKDASANPVPNAQVSFTALAGNGSATNATAATNSSGVASAGAWTLGTAVKTDTLIATAVGLVGPQVVFTANATPGPLAGLAVVTQPSDTAGYDSVFARQPVVRQVDQFGNTVKAPAITIAAAAPLSTDTLAGTLQATTDATGSATWTNLKLTGTVGQKQLRFTSGSFAVNSQAFTLVAGSHPFLELTTPPSASVINGQAFPQQPVITLRQATGPVSGLAVTVQLDACAPQTIPLTGATTATTNPSGVAIFSALTLTGKVGSCSLIFRSTGFIGVSSSAITVTAGAPATMVANSLISQSGRLGGPVDSLPSVLVKDQSGNPVPGQTVAFAIGSGGGSLSGASPTTDGQGVARLGGWTLGLTVGANSVTATLAPLPVVTFTAQANFVPGSIALGGGHTCAATVDGLAFCWGADTAGQLGDGTTVDRGHAAPVSGGRTYGAIFAGRNYTCASTTPTPVVYCWGENGSGQLGIGTQSNQPTPVSVTTSGITPRLLALSLAATKPHSCAYGQLDFANCWGSDTSGQFGVGADASPTHTLPFFINLPTVVTWTAGAGYSCAIFSSSSTSGPGVCMGNNDFGQLGNGDNTKAAQNTPVQIQGGLSFSQLAASTQHTCGLTTSGTVYCWGSNANGRLGQPATTTESLVPVQVSGVSGVVQLVAGEGHTCARTSGNQVLCWGQNDAGQLGVGGTADGFAPAPVSLPVGVTGFTLIGTGVKHSCGVSNTGKLYCWGLNSTGQLGDGSTTNRPTPMAVNDP